MHTSANQVHAAHNGMLESSKRADSGEKLLRQELNHLLNTVRGFCIFCISELESAWNPFLWAWGKSLHSNSLRR